MLRISDEDSSVVVRLPGHVSGRLTGRVVITDTVDAEGELIATEITSIKGRVIDVCDLLAPE